MLLDAAVATILLLGDPAPTVPLADRVAAERARNATLRPFIPPTLTLPRLTPSVPPPPPADDAECCLKRLPRPGPAPNHPDYPYLLLSLVAHFDEQRTNFDARAAELDAERNAAIPSERPRRDNLYAKQVKFQAQAREASEQMLKLLKVLVTTPQYQSFKHLEEAQYLYFQELHALGRDIEAKDAAIRLIQDYPNGPYMARAYALFAVYYLNKRKHADAAQLFERVLADPAHSLDALGYLGLGWSHLGSIAGQPPRVDLALDAFVRAIQAATHDDDLLRSAHDGLVHAYAAAGRPDRAAAFFTRMAALPHPVARRDIVLLGRLALAFFARGEHRESAQIYRDLLRLHPQDPETCTWQTRLLLTAVAARDHKAEQREALRLAATWKTWRDADLHTAPLRTRCRDDARDALLDLIQRPHDDRTRPALCAAHRDLFPEAPPLCPAP